jgi:hypothetical protein
MTTIRHTNEQNTSDQHCGGNAAGHRRSLRNGARVAVGLGLAATIGFGAQTFAGISGEAPDTSPPPGEPVVPEPADGPALTSGDGDSLVTTSSANYDPTILTKFIHARGFTAMQGDPLDNTDDRVDLGPHGCLSPSAASTGTLTRLYAPVELPDGARIKRVEFYGDDNSADDIVISLHRTTATLGPFLAPTAGLSSATVTSFSTSGVSAGDAVAFMSDDNLDEVTGSYNTGGIVLGTDHNFHTVQVAMDNAALADQLLCGVEIEYQVPLAEDAGEAYFPIEPMRVFDSRIDTYDEFSLLIPNDSKVIDVSDGYDLDGVAIPGLVDAVPADATAITYNIAVAGTTGPNFVSVTAGDATEFNTAVLNFGVGQALSNSATVPVDGSQQIKVWGGDQGGAAHVIIDVTGYYAPGAHPNMGN